MGLATGCHAYGRQPINVPLSLCPSPPPTLKSVHISRWRSKCKKGYPRFRCLSQVLGAHSSVWLGCKVGDSLSLTHFRLSSLLEWLTQLRKTFTYCHPCIIKNTSKHPDEEVHRVKSRGSFAQELLCLWRWSAPPSWCIDVFTSRMLCDPHGLEIPVEVPLQKHDWLNYWSLVIELRFLAPLEIGLKGPTLLINYVAGSLVMRPHPELFRGPPRVTLLA